MQETTASIAVLDGRNLTFRMGHAHKFLATSSGEPSGALYGAAGLLLRLKKKLGCKFVAVWDGAETRTKGWRVQLYPGYKGLRVVNATPDGEAVRRRIVGQIGGVQELFELLCIPQLEVPGLEADDLISLISLELVQKGYCPYIYSSDKDFCQLMSRGVKLIRDVDKADKLRAETEIDVQKHFGCRSQDVLKIRAFLGDASDCIKPVYRGVGPVGANRYLTLGVDPSCAQFNQLPGAIQAQAIQLKASWKQLHVNYQLMKLIDSLEDERLSSEQKKKIASGVDKCLHQLAQMPQVNYSRLLRFLGGYEMMEAMKHRRELCQIQEG